MTTFKVVVRKKRADGFYPVYIRVVHRSRMVYYGVIGAVMVSIILYLYKLDKKICTEKHNQYGFYAFYPTHLLLYIVLIVHISLELLPTIYLD